MPNLLDIGTSAVMAYRAALTTTGENIANADTDGYTRRDIQIHEVRGGKMSAVSKNSGGQGVIVDDVRRSYDAFLSERVRSTASAFSSAEAFADVTFAIEDLFMPTTGGIAKGLDGFFSSLSTLSGNPSDIALRQSSLEAGRAMATSIADVATGLLKLREDVVVQAHTAVGMLNEKLSQLTKLQLELSGATNENGGLNPMFDERDRLLNDISEITGTNTQIDQFGRAVVRLGDTLGGPMLADNEEASTVAVEADTDLRLNITRDGETKQSTQISGGLIQGYRNAIGALDEAMIQLDAFARRVTRDINALHASGIDQQGNVGGEMFNMIGFTADASAGNRGTAYIEFTITSRDQAAELPQFELVRDNAAGTWTAQDADGNVLASGANILVMDGLTLTISGTPANGDRYTITPVSGRAVDMAMVLTEPQQFAAAASSLVVADASNLGSGSAVMARVPVATPAVDDLAATLTATSNGADAVSLLSAGVVGYVPAGAKSLNLSALGQQSTMDFVLNDADAGGVSSLSFTSGGTTQTFTLAGQATVADLAAALNNGTLTTASGETLADFGVHAAGTDGVLTLALGDGDFGAAATLSGGMGNVSGLLQLSEPSGGTVQVFTRNGVQIAGTALDAATAANMLTEANGFLAGASYIDDYLYPEGATGYRGATVSQQTLPGAHVVEVPLAAPQTWASPAVGSASSPETLTLSYVEGEDLAIDLSAGMSAARAAVMLNDSVEGMNASARTTLDLQITGDGTVAFRLEGDNTAALNISALVVNGDLNTLAYEINDRLGSTGISAQLSPNGDRIVLVHEGGENIKIEQFAHSGGGTMTIQEADSQGLPAGNAVTLGAGNDAVNFTGHVTIEAPSAFGVGYGATMYASNVDPLVGGLVTQSYGQAGSIQTFTFAGDDALDGGASSLDGLAAMAPNAKYSVDVRGLSVSYTGASGAAGLAAEMRATAPQSSLTGAAVASLPVTGAGTTVMLGEEAYVLRMGASGAITITGPEEGRLSASFDASNQLQITVNDGTLNGEALRVPAGASGAAAFGLLAGLGATTTIQGGAMDAGGLPSTLDIDVDGTIYTVGVSTAGATLPAGFPGTASMNAGQLSFEFEASVGPVSIPQTAGGTAAGFATLGMRAKVDGDSLTFTATDGAAIDADMSVSALSSQRISLSDLPDEDLIVFITGAPPLRLAGGYEAGEVSEFPSSVRVEVVDGVAGTVRLVDDETGHTIAQKSLDANNSAILNDIQFAMTGQPENGDSFSLVANSGFVGDSRNINAMSDLRSADPTTGKGGFGRILAALQAQKGAVVAAAKARVSVTDVARESAERVYDDRTSVNLDVEAARLVENQQAYQASAQILAVANDLFDTLLSTIRV
ncbi:flagellar hook-associated protein FlgK [Marivivens aquimaris]|uniref:flagellar hook-associated protein FlgK n=1 Tax=Marivivens aquimaris TaxID=2774876 RepID=UPI001880F6B7|nr:flagellar hook-associated protein FlgK [Marivivens aquimaris]